MARHECEELYQAGRLTEAVQALGAELRDNPADTKRRTFLFELLSFAGEYDRAQKQLDVLAQQGPQAEMGALLYRAAIQAERQRQELFRSKRFPERPPRGRSGLGHPQWRALRMRSRTPTPRRGTSGSLRGRDLRVDPAGSHHIHRDLATEALRDLLWIPALVRTGPWHEGQGPGATC